MIQDDIETGISRCASALLIAQLMFQKDLETIKKRYRQKIDKEVVMMICALTGSRRLELIISKEEGDEIDMCKAIEEWEEEISKQARNEGRLKSERKQILQFIQEMLEKDIQMK